MDDNYWILIASWLIYFVVHSFMATLGVKLYFENKGISKTTYRLFYTTGSAIGLFILLFYGSTFEEKYLIEMGSIQKYLSLALAASGTIVIRSAFKQYNLKAFLGFSAENPTGKFVTAGILSYVRHPIYTGTILIILGYFLYIPKLSSLIITLIVVGYLIVGILLEEKKLEKEFGETYIDYKKRVPALFPRWKDLFKN